MPAVRIISLILLFLFVSIGNSLHATHLVGGYIYYECLGPGTGGNFNYNVTVKVYRDCNPGSFVFDDEVIVASYSPTGFLEQTVIFPRDTIVSIPLIINNPCLVAPPSACVEEGTFSGVIALAPGTVHTLVHQRCCRNGTIDNLTQPGDQGNTYTIDVPSFSNPSECNSSPQFNNFPPIGICSLEPLNLDQSAVDVDGDILLYELCTPLQTQAGINDPIPDPPLGPPYPFVNYSGGFDALNPFPTLSGLQIDPNTGILTGTPSQLGQYVVGICVREIRNGQLISLTRRDFQFNMADCQRQVVSAIQDQQLFCDGLTVRFNNLSFNANDFFWDFGDPTSTADTSSLREPSYQYPDTGTYTITLIANPGVSCGDTSTVDFVVRTLLEPDLDFDGNFCLDSNEVDFNASGIFESYANFQWSFGSEASIPASASPTPPPVNYGRSGTFPVQLVVSQDECRDTVEKNVEVYPNPESNFTFGPSVGCGPLTVNFTNTSSVLGEADYFWDFGDNTFSNDVNTSHDYTRPGYYTAGLLLISKEFCVDTVVLSIDSAIQVFPNPLAGFNVSDTSKFIKEANIEFTGNSFGASQYAYSIGNQLISNQEDFSYLFRDTGHFNVTQVVTNQFGCRDTADFTVLIFDQFEFIIPNIFTPNNDEVNDVFIPNACGVYDYKMEIFSRWGNKIFESNALDFGWDGRVNGYPAETGVYLYKIRLKDFEGTWREYVGTCTLLY